MIRVSSKKRTSINLWRKSFHFPKKINYENKIQNESADLFEFFNFFSSNVEMFFLAFTVLSSAYYVNYLEIKM